MNIFKTEITEICRHVAPGDHNRLTHDTEGHANKGSRCSSAAAPLDNLASYALYYGQESGTSVQLPCPPGTPVQLWHMGPNPFGAPQPGTFPPTAATQRFGLSVSSPRLEHDASTSHHGRPLGYIQWRPDIPAFTQMAANNAPSDAGKWRGRPRTTLPIILDADLVSIGQGYRLRDAQDLEGLRILAGNRGGGGWRILLVQ